MKTPRLVRGVFAVLHCSVGEACYKGVHFLFRTDIVGFVQNVLPLGFRQVGVAVHGGGVGGKSQAKANGDVIEIHSNTLLCLQMNNE